MDCVIPHDENCVGFGRLLWPIVIGLISVRGGLIVAKKSSRTL